MNNSHSTRPRAHKMLLTATGVLLIACLTAGPVSAATVEFWHPWRRAQRTVADLAAAYHRRTGTVVRVRVFNPTSYRPWTGKQTPDLIGLDHPTKPGIKDLVKAGRISDLQLAMSRGWYTVFWPGMLETFSIRGGGKVGLYGVPLTGHVSLFVYNQALFRKAGIQTVPRTWRELMAAARKLVKIGVTPYAGGFGSDRPPLAAAYEWSYLGLHKLSETYFGRYPYTSPEWISYLSIYPEMRRNGFTDATRAGMSGVLAVKALCDNRVGMVFTDASFQSIQAAYKPSFMGWGVFGVPVDDRAPFLPRLPGGVAEGLVVNSRSIRKTEAIAFAKWLTEPGQQIALANGASSIPATSAVSSSPRLRAHLRVFDEAGMGDEAIDMRIYESPRVLSTFYSGVRGLLAGHGTPRAVANAAQAAKRR